MSYKVTIKKSTKCKHCKGLGFYTFDHYSNNNCKLGEASVEYYCSKCDGEGKTWKEVDVPLSSLKTLLK